MELKLEVIVIPVSDVDKALYFYRDVLGWRLDADFSVEENYRIVQVTPPGSPSSVIFGEGLTTAAPASAQGLYLVVTDIQKTRDELADLGVDISEVFHDRSGVFNRAGTAARVPGPDPEGRSYTSHASFQDPDGNEWVLQEVTERLPGR